MAAAATNEDFDAWVVLYDAVRNLRSRWIFEVRNGKRADWSQAKWNEDPDWLIEIDVIACKCHVKVQDEVGITQGGPPKEICLCELQELTRRTAGILRSKADALGPKLRKR